MADILDVALETAVDKDATWGPSVSRWRAWVMSAKLSEKKESNKINDLNALKIWQNQCFQNYDRVKNPAKNKNLRNV